MKTIAHVSYSGITPQCEAMLNKLVAADKIANDIACGEHESYSTEGIMAVASEAEINTEKWMIEVIGSAEFGELLLRDPMQNLCAARDRLEENDRPVSRAQAKIEHRIMQAKEGV